jgi:hypothetical protein
LRIAGGGRGLVVRADEKLAPFLQLASFFAEIGSTVQFCPKKKFLRKVLTSLFVFSKTPVPKQKNAPFLAECAERRGTLKT